MWAVHPAENVVSGPFGDSWRRPFEARSPLILAMNAEAGSPAPAAWLAVATAGSSPTTTTRASLSTKRRTMTCLHSVARLPWGLPSPFRPVALRRRVSPALPFRGFLLLSAGVGLALSGGVRPSSRRERCDDPPGPPRRRRRAGQRRRGDHLRGAQERGGPAPGRTGRTRRGAGGPGGHHLPERSVVRGDIPGGGRRRRHRRARQPLQPGARARGRAGTGAARG